MKTKKSKAVSKKPTARATKKQSSNPSQGQQRRNKQHEEELDAPRCECGRVELRGAVTALPFCETCPVCDERLHTADDKAEHEQRHEERNTEKEDAEQEVQNAKQPRRKRQEDNEVRRTAAATDYSALLLAENAPRWEVFFMCQRYPMLRGQLIAAIMAGTRLEVERVSKHMLLDLVLLATACRELHDAEIVDDYQRLLERTEEEWRKPDWTCKVFSSIHADWANVIINHGVRYFEGHEVGYVPALAGWLLQHDAPDYFSEELTDEAPSPSKKGGAKGSTAPLKGNGSTAPLKGGAKGSTAPPKVANGGTAPPKKPVVSVGVEEVLLTRQHRKSKKAA